MKVHQKLWKNANINKGLYLFPGQLGEFLEITTPAAIVRAQNFLPHIFWRWYFLENGIEDRLTPYQYLQSCRRWEGWPDKGQFFPKPKITVASSNKVQIDLTVDYISFEEQPLLVDLDRALEGKDLILDYGKDYSKDILFLAKRFKGQKINPKYIAGFYLNHKISSWYENDELIRTSFKKSEWIEFWRLTLKKISRNEFYDTSDLNDRYVEAFRRYFPDHGLTNEEMKFAAKKRKKVSLKDEYQGAGYYHFWLGVSTNFIVPLSLYLHLLAPVFIDRQNFKDDIKDLLENYYDDPIPIYSPCTFISFTPFGKMIQPYVFDHLQNN